MLARTLGPKFSQFPCFVQPKLNGVRALYQDMTFQSRDEKVWNSKVLDHLALELGSLAPTIGNLILDGELYVHGWRLQRINGAVAVNRKEPSEDTPHVEFHVFDVVDLAQPFSRRFLPFWHVIRDANLPHIKAVDTAYVHDRTLLDQLFHHFTKEGYEGVMLRPDGPYEFGEHLGRGGTMTSYRSRTLWKYKSWLDDEFVVVGFTKGEGKADIGIGALILTTGVPTPTFWQDYTPEQWNQIKAPTFKVGTGLTDEERIEFAVNPPIGKLVKIRYLCLTADSIPFNPSFLCVMS